MKGRNSRDEDHEPADPTARFHDTMDSRSLTLLGTPVLQDVVDDTGQVVKKEKEAFVPVWKQTVTDEQGRRRFHGAFTGGFSAGYFNSVGSKEGWTPATFVSTRDARAQAQQRVEDFMDDEDRQTGLATTAEAKSGYGLFADPSARSARDKAADSVEGAMAALLQPAPDTVGLALMRKVSELSSQSGFLVAER
jgi:G patch domain-containing protein 1